MHARLPCGCRVNLCCQSGYFDECGVCDGDDASCATSALLSVQLNISSTVTPRRPPAPTQTSARRPLRAGPQHAPMCARGGGASADP